MPDDAVPVDHQNHRRVCNLTVRVLAILHTEHRREIRYAFFLGGEQAPPGSIERMVSAELPERLRCVAPGIE